MATVFVPHDNAKSARFSPRSSGRLSTSSSGSSSISRRSHEHGASTAHVARIASSRAACNQGTSASTPGAPTRALARAPAPPVPQPEPAPEHAGVPQVPRLDLSRILGITETQAVGHDPSSTPDPVSPSLSSVSSVPSTPSSVDA
ncbi:hypothetical protein FOA52_014841 [Chlamydomonas sp. UWO 241]|nr:hypothetical protein FOA52_014841 [Chlamydomonas sp. UWO 241]